MYKGIVASSRRQSPSPGRCDRRAPRLRSNHRRLALCALSIAALLTSRSVAVAAGATITGVAFQGTNAALTIIISGSGFGIAPPGIPCKSCTTPYISIGGRIGCLDSYNIVSWKDNRIVLSGFQANPDNQILVSVENPGNKTVGVLSTTTPQSIRLTSTKIAKVAFVGSGRNLQMTITGSGFGPAPPGVPGEGINLPFFVFTDLAFQTGQWNAGYNGCGNDTSVTLNYASWSDTKIVISGFGSLYGKGPRVAHFWRVTPGDVVSIAVANSAYGLKIGYGYSLTAKNTFVLFANPLGTGALWAGTVP